MNIKNYTSTVPAMNSANAIEALLVAVGAESVNRWYVDKELAGFLFSLPVNGRVLVFRLPANVPKVTAALRRSFKKVDAAKLKQIQAQAGRTAWRTLYEWVRIQVDMILIEQVEPLQIFLPYNYSQDSGHTFYDEVKEGTVRLLN
jgi:hypothetical protein